MGRLLLIVALQLVTVAAVASDQPFRFTKDGLLSSGKSFRVEIVERSFMHSATTLPDDGSMWCTDRGYPSYVVDRFVISAGGAPIAIPKKFYSDICDLSQADAFTDRDQIVISLSGGDAAGSFSAEYRFSLNGSFTRIVRSGEFPEEHWERTEFHVDFPDDM